VTLYLRIMEDLHGRSELSRFTINDLASVCGVVSESLLVKLGSKRLPLEMGAMPPVEDTDSGRVSRRCARDFRFRTRSF
jgi:hypothetical protein